VRFEGKVVFITGGTRGIGLATARRFAREGALVGLCARDAAAAAEAAKSLGADGREGLGYGLDVGDRAQVERTLGEFVQAAGGRLDVLVNNAGLTRDGLILRMSDAQWAEVMRINLTGTFHCTKAALRVMIRQRAGRIVNVTSVSAIMGNPGQANYAASKGGIIAFTKTVAKEVASRRITVNAVAPGFIKTVLTDAMTPKARDAVREKIPLGRFGDPEDVAATILFLASDDAAYMTGQVVQVDGGLAM
jgi:3-oxoacyl-[acyl-carrier protein] reductase